MVHTPVRNCTPALDCFGPPSSDLLFNPTVLLFLASILVAVLGTFGYVSGILGDVAVAAINSLALYLAFTVLHDAAHGTAHRRPWVCRMLGTVTGFLLTFNFPFFRAIHLRHHAYTNDCVRDLDAVTARFSPVQALFFGGTAVYLSYHRSYFRSRLWRSRAELAEVVGSKALHLGILMAAIAGGWFRSFLVLYLVPLFVILHLLVFTFDYLPHYPHDSTDRLYSTRAYGGLVMAILHLNQNFHLIHHLHPRIPWFRYRRAYLATRAALEARGCRVSWTVTPLPPAATTMASPEIVAVDPRDRTDNLPR